MLVLLALGGNAMTSPDGRARPEDQIAAARVAMAAVAELVTRPDDRVDVVVTHGNGPQVGNLLVKNELAASVVPPVPLDWCGAQTQATLGFVLMNALEHELARRGTTRRTATVVTRTRVDADDPGLVEPSKPIGRYLPREDAEMLMDHGETWQDRGPKGWRRVVASPEPREILDAEAVRTLVEAGYVVVANGGGGIPVVRTDDGLAGVEAVIDKDLGAALLARSLGAEVLVVATDVPAAMIHFGTPEQRAVGRVTVGELRSLAAEGHFASGSMGPKVEALCRFVEAGGARGVITDLDHITEAVLGEGLDSARPSENSARPTGTVVVPD